MLFILMAQQCHSVNNVSSTYVQFISQVTKDNSTSKSPFLYWSKRSYLPGFLTYRNQQADALVTLLSYLTQLDDLVHTTTKILIL